MAGNSIGLVLKIAADTRQAVNDIQGVNNALEGTGTTTSKVSGIFGALKGPAAMALGAIGGAALGAAAAMVSFGQAAWEDHQEAERLAHTLEKIPGVTREMIDANEDWITSAMFATHVTDSDLRVGIEKLILVTGDLAVAQQYAAAAADVATVANVDYSTAVETVQDALSGKTRGLMDLLPQLDANKDGTLSLAEAQGILTDETIAGAAEAAAAEDPWTTISIIFDEIKEALGQWLIPLFERLGEWFKDPNNQQKIQTFIDKLSNMSTTLGEKLLPYLEDFLNWLSSDEGQQDIRNFADACQDVARAFGGIYNGIKKIADIWDSVPDWLKSSSINGSDWLHGAFGPRSTGWAAPSGPALYAAPAAPRTVINFNGIVTDPEATARAIDRVGQASTRRNARERTAAIAW